MPGGSLPAADPASMAGQEDALHRALTDRLVALTAVYAELKSKQLTLGIMLICAAVGVVCACVGFVCWWEGQASESTETPYEERTRRFQAAFGSGSGSGPKAAGTAGDPFAERQRQLRQRVRILPADEDDADDAGVVGQPTGQACEPVTASASGSSADTSLRQRKRDRRGSTYNTIPGQLQQATGEQAAGSDGASVAPLGAAGAAATDKKSTERGGWSSWLPFSKSAPTEGTTAQGSVQEQYAQRQAYLRQQITILPADSDSDE